MPDALVLAPTPDPHIFLASNGKRLTPPAHESAAPQPE
jgi:hypothetical protein